MRLTKLLILALIIITSSCNKTIVATDNFYVTFSGTLSGTTQVPANTSKATGTIAATYNKNTRILLVNVPYSGLTATAAHIHKGAIGTSGAIIFTFSSLASPMNFASVALDATQEADLLSSNYYVDIHSAAFTNGEIRGQLIKQ